MLNKAPNRRIWIYIIGAVLVIAAAGGLIAAMENSKDHNNKAAGSAGESTAFPQRKACAIFMLADAKQVLGDSAKGGSSPIYDNPQSDLNASLCSYTQDSGSNVPVSAKKSASLLVRTPESAVGAVSNRNQFGRFKPADAQTVAGYGDSAYWDAQHGQLNILKNDTWYVLSSGPVTPADRSLDQAKELAGLLINKM